MQNNENKQLKMDHKALDVACIATFTQVEINRCHKKQFKNT